MNLSIFILSYIEWHYTRSLRNLLQIISNIFVFTFNFFSIPILASTLFSPWRRLGEVHQGGILEIGEMLSVFVVNTLMRIVGFIIRFLTITIGLVASGLVILVGVVVFGLWLLWPFLIFIFLLNGFYFMIN